jgi:sugar O-acyltransferase (sialic acid O-acetyltransferase NeuD family)
MRLALFGNGGHAKEVASQIDRPITFFVDDEYVCDGVKPISQFDPTIWFLMVAIADPIEREKIVKRLPENTKYFQFVHPTAILMNKNIVIGEGSFVGAYSIITTNVKIGKHSILNRGNQIGHDCSIGDYLSMMPGSIISGNVNVGDRVYMGTNSTIIENKFISSDVIIGANGVVVKNINTNGTYVGVPVKKINNGIIK